MMVKFTVPNPQGYGMPKTNLRIFKTKSFAKFAKKEDLTDEELLTAIGEMEGGLVDANLGGNVYKKRISINGRGKSGGIRTIICYKMGRIAFFVDGFKKNDSANLTKKELAENQQLAEILLAMNDKQIENFKMHGEIVEVPSAVNQIDTTTVRRTGAEPSSSFGKSR